MRDFDRELTGAGRREVKDIVAGIALYIEPGSHVQVWTSPLTRARQTARILVDGLHRATLVEREEIPSGDLIGLAAYWENMKDEDVIIIVGHEPYLSEWCNRLTGAIIPFKVASAVGIEIKETHTLEGKLRWYAHPSILARLGKR